MRLYLAVASVAMLILSVWAIPLVFLFPYAALNLAFLSKKDPPRWLRLTLQYASLALAILAGVFALLCFLINTPDLILTGFSFPLSLIAVHGIIEFCYLRALPSADSRSIDMGIE
ncbi:MAG: hypothetical protein PVI78_13235 [Anaerolineales bacterium]|jgi:hypothetical protein